MYISLTSSKREGILPTGFDRDRICRKKEVPHRTNQNNFYANNH